MLRSTYDQRSIWEPSPRELALDDDEFEHALREHLTDVIALDDVAAFYHEGCGPSSCCPIRLAGMSMLRFRYGLSQREVVKRCRRDGAFRYALRLGYGEPPSSKSTLKDFEAKVREHLGEDFIHRRVLRLAILLELLYDDELQAVDSTNMSCRGAVLDTFNLIARAIALVLREAAQCLNESRGELADAFGMSQYLVRSVKGRVQVDWTDETARNEFLTQEIRDAEALVEVFGDPASFDDLPSTKLQEAVHLLDAVAHQDAEQLADGTYRIRKGTAKGRIISISDPEARHGRKSASKVIHGHKTHVMGTVESAFVTAIEITDASVHDAKPTPKLLDQAEANGVKPKDALSDLAYGTGANRRACADKGVVLRTKVASPNAKDHIPKQAFDIDLDAERVTCPAGQSTERYSTVKDSSKSEERVRQFRFDKAVCAACPQASLCCADTRTGKGRTIKLSLYERELQDAKAFASSPEGKALLKKRCAIERIISHLVYMGLRVARFYGIAHTRFQAFMTAAAYNFQRIATLLARRRRQQRA